MWLYWLMFLVPAAAALRAGTTPLASTDRNRRWSPIWFIAALSLALLIGYRHEVGGDWFTYMELFREHQHLLTDPGYRALNWAVAYLGGDIYEVNLACGAIFSFCLVYFCRILPRPWLALSIAMPYLVIVVGMGYSRQAVALALVMCGLSVLERKRVFWFVALVLIGATFHKTAVLLLPIVALSKTRNKYWTAVWVGVVGLAGYQLFLADAAETLYASYIESEYESEGALVRIMMNALAGSALLLWRRRFRLGEQASLWTRLAAISVLMPLLLVVSESSTAVDRMALYLIPLQLVVFTQLPDVLGRSEAAHRRGWILLILLYYSAVQFTWLNFATHSHYWVPYRFYPLDGVL